MSQLLTQHTQRCLDHLLVLEQQVEEQRLFNVGYIIPQVTLLETQWQTEQKQGDFELFLQELRQLVNAHGQTDGLEQDDLEANAAILNQLASALCQGV